MKMVSEPRRPLPTAFQGWILVSGSWLAVMAPAIISPILPRMTSAYRGVPHEAVLVALAATLPALFVALLAIPSGALADRVGSRSLLLAGLAVYAALGTAPWWLRTLPHIVLSRAGVGIAEALILTCSTTLLGEYFAGDQRARWLALQTGSANIIAIAVTGLSGALGEHTWRTPFLVYGLSLLQLPLVAAFIWEPRTESQARSSSEFPSALQSSSASHASAISPELAEDTSAFRWRGLVGLCLVTTFASTAFYLVVVQLGFLLTERGIVSPKLIGRGTAIAILSLPLGAILSRLLRISYMAKTGLSFLFSSLGLLVVALAHTYGLTILGGVITDLGSGLALTTLITWALSGVPMRLRGRATGAWQGAFAFGQFASPLIVVGLSRALGGRSQSVLCYAILCGAAAILAAVLQLRTRRATLRVS